MCSTPSVPQQSNTTTQKKEEVVQTQANASQTKADATTQNVAQSSVLGSRNKQTGLAGRDVKTSARGLGDTATVSRKALLGE